MTPTGNTIELQKIDVAQPDNAKPLVRARRKVPGLSSILQDGRTAEGVYLCALGRLFCGKSIRVVKVSNMEVCDKADSFCSARD